MMSAYETVKLKRDCESAQIPSGARILLPEGMEVRITQSLGGSFTVITQDGFMVRISAEDADALGRQSRGGEEGTGREASAPPSIEPLTAEAIEKKVWEALRTCYDPEIPINIADLGLIYDCKITPITFDPLPPEGGEGSLPAGQAGVRGEKGYRVEIHMTLTAPGCGMGDVLRGDVQGKVLRIPGVKQADIQLVWEPVWNQSRMSEAAKLQLGIL